VILGCAAVVNVPPNVVPVIAPFTLNDVRPVRFAIVAVVVLIEPAVILPVTVKAVRLPRLVMLFKVPSDSVPLKVPPAIVPGTVKLPIVAVVALRLPASTVPLTVKLPKVPRLVILGCAAVVNVPPSVVPVIAPFTLKDVKPVKLAIVAVVVLIDPAVILPVTVNAVKLPNDVMLLNAPSDRVPLKVPPVIVPGTVKLPIVAVVALRLPASTVPLTVKLPKVPRLVILGCAAVVNVPPSVVPVIAPFTLKDVKPVKLAIVAVVVLIDPAVILPVTVNAVKLPNDVMLLNVPSDRVPLKVPPVIVPGTVKLPIVAVVALRLPASTVPLTVKLPKVPRLVILGCAAVVNVPPSVVPVIAPFTDRLVKPVRFAMVAVVVLIDPAVILPDTVKAVKLPRLVILFNVPSLNVPLKVPPVIVPGTVKLPMVAVAALRLPASTVLLTVKLPNVPRLVILGCAAVVNVPPSVVPVIAPFTLNDVRPVRFAIVAVVVLIDPAVILPVTVNAVKLPNEVILFNVPSLNVPLKVPPVIVPGTVKLPIVAVVALRLPASTVPLTVKLPKVPRLVILGCAAVVSVPPSVVPVIAPFTLNDVRPVRFAIVAVVVLIDPAVILPVTVKAVRLPRLVMLFKVPSDNVPLKVPPVIVPGTVKLPIVAVVALRLPASTVPLTVKLPKVPRLVILGCAAVVSVPPNVVPVIAPFTDRLVKPVRFAIVAVVVLIEPAVILPVTVKAVRLPRLVMLFNAPSDSVPLKVPPVIVPGTVKLPIVAVVTLRLPASTVPLTVKLPKVPRLVILGCAAVVNVPPSVVPVIAPFTDKLVKPVRFAIVAVVVLIEPAVILPVTVNAVKLPNEVMLLNVPSDRVPLKVPPVIVPGTVKLPIVAVVALRLPASTVPLTVKLPKVPRLVILGCAAVVNVPPSVVPVIAPFTLNDVRPVRFAIVAVVVLIEPAVILPVTVNAVKLPRLVMLLKVPSDSVPLKVPPVIVPGTVKLPMVAVVALRLPASTVPLTVKLPNVPRLVILGCTAVVNVPPSVVPVIAPFTDRLVKPVRFAIVAVVVLIDPAVILPVTVKAVKLPRLVMLFKVPSLNVPLKVPPVIVPGTVKLPSVAVVALILPASTVPLTVKPPNVPRLVILGCAAVVNVPPNVVPVIAPFTDRLVKPVRFAIVAVVVLIEPAVILPVTVKAVKLPRLVILFNVPSLNVPLKVPPVIVPGTVKLPMVAVAALRLPASTVLLTVKLPNVPRLVILGCAAVVNVPPSVVPVIAPFTDRLVKPVRFAIVAVVVLIEPAVILPVTVKAVKLPRLVILFNVPSLNVPLKVPPVIVPGTVKLPMVAVAALRLPASTVLLTVKLPNVPRLVILGCAAVVNVPPSVVPVIAPFTLKDVKPVKLAIVAVVVLIEPAVILPVTVNAVKLPNEVILFKVPVDNVPLKVPPVIVPGTVKLPIVAVVALRLPASTVPLTVKLPKVPRLVILGCAAVVSVPPSVVPVIAPFTLNDVRPVRFAIVAVVVLIDPAVILPVTVKAVRLPRLVILFKVPSLNVPLKVPPVIVPGTVKLPIVAVVALRLPASTVPLTVKLPKVPRLVILGCAAVVNVPPSVVPVIAPFTDRLVKPVRFAIVAVVVLIEPAVILPVTVKAVKLPNEVMLLNVPSDSVPLKVPPAIVPGTVKLPIVAVVALRLPASTVPLTVKLPKVPRLVILGCAAVVNVPPSVVPVIAPFTLKDVKPVRFAIVAVVVLIEPAVILPVTVNAVKLPRLVMLLNAPSDRVPLKVPPVIVPGTVKLPIVAVVTLRLPASTVPLTVKLPKVPRLVILGCAAVVNVPPSVVPVIAPFTLNDVRPVRFAIVAVVVLIEPAVTLPLTVIALRLPSAVMPSRVPCDKVPL